MASAKKGKGQNFIEAIVRNDIKNNTHGGRVLTRFPPEPNGYLHIGHAKSICLNFDLAEKYGGKTNLRFDDTNPETEDVEFVESIKEDIRWLGFQWDEELYASDYFDELYQYAIKLIKDGLAYVDDSTAEEMAELKGTPTTAGKPSPYRDRSVEENLDLFERMAAGEFPEGSRVLRAKIDMAAGNMHMRDPVLYRIKFAKHHRTGDKWKIYPMYDMAHGQSDSIEKITHSVCTLEFVPHRELYDWLIEKLEIFPSRQYEFARLNMTYTIMSKRKLLKLVEGGYVNGWDDPRMPTISGMRRRGYTPQAIRDFCDRIGIQKRENLIDLNLLEFFVRRDLNKTATRVMAVMDPLRVVITNWQENITEDCLLENNPEDPEAGHRKVPFGQIIYIDQSDFMEEAPKGYHRLTYRGVVRLKGAYIIQCNEVKKTDDGRIREIRCTYIENSKSGEDVSGVRVKAAIQWVPASNAVEAEVRLYDKLFDVENPAETEDFLEHVNKDSLQVKTALVEPALLTAEPEDRFQFIRIGYFVLDKDSTPPQKLVFNGTVSLRDDYNKK